MATFLDISALQSFSNIFVFLFVWLVVYAILLYTKIMGQNRYLPILIALMLALFSLFSDTFTRIILNIVPWIVLIFVLIFLLTVAIQSFGGGGTDAPGIQGLNIVLLVIVGIAVIVGVLAEVRQSVTVPGEDDDTEKDFSKMTTVFFHPNFLGMMFLLGLAIFTIALLASKNG